jgi:AraC family transcriptional regulator
MKVEIMYERLSAGRFYGQTLKRYESPGLNLSESRYQPHTRLARHSHPNAYFCITLNGTYEEEYGNHRRACKPSTLVFHPADEVHADHFLEKGGHLFRLEVAASWAERIHPYSPVLKEAADFMGGPLVHLVTKLYRECYQPDNVSDLAIEGLALEMIAEMSRRQTIEPGQNMPRWVFDAKELLHAHFAEKLNPEAIAKLLDVHPVHLARTFRRTHGCTMGEYIRQLRIEIGAHHLSTSDLSIADISTLVGFVDQSHFSRNFKRLTGFTPAQYRSSFRPR